MYIKILLVSTLLLLTGCVSANPILPTNKPPAFKSANLEILYSETGSGNVNMTKVEYETFTLVCDSNGAASGSHPTPVEACDHLRNNTMVYQIQGGGPMACAMIYGGPQEVIVKGEINGKAIMFSIDRRDGCAISNWDSWVPVIPQSNLNAFESEFS